MNDFEQSQGRVGEWQCLGLVSQKHLSNSSLYETSVSVDQVLSAKSQTESIVTLDLSIIAIYHKIKYQSEYSLRFIHL